MQKDLLDIIGDFLSIVVVLAFLAGCAHLLSRWLNIDLVQPFTLVLAIIIAGVLVAKG